MQNTWVQVFHKDEIQLYVLYQYLKIKANANANMFVCHAMNSVWQGLSHMHTTTQLHTCVSDRCQLGDWCQQTASMKKNKKQLLAKIDMVYMSG